MAYAAITVTGLGTSWTLYPSAITPTPFLIGGPIRRSVNGKGYRRITGQKTKVILTWDQMGPDEFQLVKIIWEMIKAGTVTLACADPAISGSFLSADETLPFEKIPGNTRLVRGALTFEEV